MSLSKAPDDLDSGSLVTALPLCWPPHLSDIGKAEWKGTGELGESV